MWNLFKDALGPEKSLKKGFRGNYESFPAVSGEFIWDFVKNSSLYRIYEFGTKDLLPDSSF